MKFVYIFLLATLMIISTAKAQAECERSLTSADEGEKALVNGESYKVVNLFSCALTNDTSSKNFLYRGIGYYRLYMYTEAITDFNSAISIDPQNPTVYATRAFVLSLIGEYTQALQDYEKFLHLSNNTYNTEVETVYLQKGFIEALLGKYDNALDTYNKVVNKSPSNALSYLMIGNLYAKLEETDKAQEFWQTALAMNKYVISSYLWDVNLYISAKNYRVALEMVDNALNIIPDYYEAYYYLGYINFSGEKYEIAKNYFDMAIERNTNMLRAYHFRGISKRMLGDTTGALADFNFILKNISSYEALNERGKLYSADHKLDLAISDFKLSIQIEPEQVDAYLELGNLFYEDSNYAQARVYYEMYTNVAGILASKEILEKLEEISKS